MPSLHDLAVLDEFVYDERLQSCHIDSRPWPGHYRISISSNSNEALNYSQFEGAILPLNGFPIEVDPRAEAFANILSDPFLPTSTPGSDPLRPIFNPSRQPGTLVRPVGYEDRSKRKRTTKAHNDHNHPQQYVTNWNAFTSSNTRPRPPASQQNEIIYNFRASNIDRGLSQAAIEAFFKARCTYIQDFRLKGGPLHKVVFLAVSHQAAWNDVLALDGHPLGRHRIKVEVDASGFQTDA